MQNSLRPKNFNEFVGQESIKKTLKIMINSSIVRKKQLEHILFYGPPGLGKTSLASIISKNISSNIKYAQGINLEKKSDVLTLFTSLSKGDVLFIDEFHGINKNVEELLYSAIEDNIIDIITGHKGHQKIIRMKLPDFTLVAATTLISKISKPMNDRFGYIAKFSSYLESEIEGIVYKSAKKLKINIEEKSIKIIATNSRKIPRVANNLLKRVYDYSIYKKKNYIDSKTTLDALKMLGIFEYGFDLIHINYLNFLNNNFKNKYVSISLLANLLVEEKTNIENHIEPMLLFKNFIIITSKGRKITNEGIEYITNNKI